MLEENARAKRISLLFTVIGKIDSRYSATGAALSDSETNKTKMYTNTFRLVDAGEAFAFSILPAKVSSWIFKKTRKPEVRADHLVNLDVDTVIDWDGCCLSPKVLTLIKTGFVVRIAVRNTNTDERGMIYFRILEIDTDGTVWGKALDIYRTKRRCEEHNCDYVMPNGSIHAFRLDNIAEIPIMWQSRTMRKKLESFRTDDNHAFTGLGALGSTDGVNLRFEEPDKSHLIDDPERVD